MFFIFLLKGNRICFFFGNDSFGEKFELIHLLFQIFFDRFFTLADNGTIFLDLILNINNKKFIFAQTVFRFLQTIAILIPERSGW